MYNYEHSLHDKHILIICVTHASYSATALSSLLTAQGAMTTQVIEAVDVFFLSGSNGRRLNTHIVI